MYSMRQIMCFWNTEACKSILEHCKNKILNIENKHNRSSLIQLNAVQFSTVHFSSTKPDTILRTRSLILILYKYIFVCFSYISVSEYLLTSPPPPHTHAQV